MMNAGYNSHSPYGQQPGLEVVDTDHPGLEVIHDQSYPEVRPQEYHHNTKEAVANANGYTPYPDRGYSSPAAGELGQGVPTNGARKRRLLWIIVGVIIAVVVILAAVLGGVLGSRASKSSGDSATSTSQGSGDTGGSEGSGGSGSSGSSGGSGESGSGSTGSAKPAKDIRPGSGLSVTGWRMPDGSADTYLFYQDPQDGLRYSRCETSGRKPNNDSACWGAPVNFTSTAKPGTPLAVSIALWGDVDQPQIELFYVGGKTLLLGVNFNEQFAPGMSEGSISTPQLYTGLDSSLATYWPWVIYQDPNNMLYYVRNELNTADWSPHPTWENTRINQTALAASRLAVVPTSTIFTLIAATAGYAVFYQDANNKLAVTIPGLDSSKTPSNFHQPWPTTLPDVTLPKLAPIAAFSVARKGDALNRVDTYVLYLDGDANINVLYTEASSSASSAAGGAAWKTAAPDALRGADGDTDIACLTMATSNNNAAKKAVPLEEASADTRCYFQRGGAVAEVRLDQAKQDWVATGTVPIP